MDNNNNSNNPGEEIMTKVEMVITMMMIIQIKSKMIMVFKNIITRLICIDLYVLFLIKKNES